MTTTAAAPTSAMPASPCPCVRTSDLPARVVGRLLPLEAVRSAFVDAQGDGIAVTDRRLIMWNSRGATTSFLLDEVSLEYFLSGTFATLVVSTTTGGRYSRVLRVEHLEPLLDFLRAFRIDRAAEYSDQWRTAPSSNYPEG